MDGVDNYLNLLWYNKNEVQYLFISVMEILHLIRCEFSNK